MKRACYCLFGCLIFSPLLAAGLLYGTLSRQGRGLSGVNVEIACPKRVYKGSTGAGGGYRIFVDETGRCEFRASGAKPAVVYSYANPAKYDFEMVRGELKRR
jgi:hypothetical protein